MPARTDTIQNEKNILWISFLAGLGFAVVELICAIYTHSQSVLMDAAYDASELVIIILTLFLTPLFQTPISEKRPYGFLQVESIFVIIKGFMMLSVTVTLSVSSIELALSGGNSVDSIQITLLQLVLGAASALVYLWMRYLNRSLSSPTVKAELLGWRQDIIYSVGMAAAFFASTFLDRTPLAFLSPYFDQLIAVVIILLTLPPSLVMLWHAICDVFLFAPEESLVDEVKSVCDAILLRHRFQPAFYDITRTGRRLWVSIYFRIEEDTLSLRTLRATTTEVASALAERFENSSSELIVLSDSANDPTTSDQALATMAHPIHTGQKS